MRLISKQCLLKRQFTQEKKSCLQLIVPTMFKDRMLKLVHKPSSEDHSAIKRHWRERWLRSSIGLMFVMMFQDPVSFMTIVKGQYRGVG